MPTGWKCTIIETALFLGMVLGAGGTGAWLSVG